MAARSSQFVRLARLSARRNVESDPDRVRNHVLLAIANRVERNKKFAIYECKVDDHSKLDNRRNAIRSKGCGCKLCTTRHEYARLKYERKIFQQSYESSFNREAFNNAMRLKGCEDVNPREFYKTEMSIYNATINDLKAQIKELEFSYGEFLDLRTA